MNFLTKIQNLPEKNRRIIFWSVVVIISLILLTFYVKNFQQRLKSFKIEEVKEQFQIPSLQEELKELPEIEMPKIKEEELKKLEEELKDSNPPATLPEGP